jgi:hypothetical protein
MKTSIIITGLICLTLLEMFALYNGIDGTLFTAVIAIIAAAIGITIPKPKFLIDEKGGK